jgi:hypothetical protein
VGERVEVLYLPRTGEFVLSGNFWQDSAVAAFATLTVLFAALTWAGWTLRDLRQASLDRSLGSRAAAQGNP